MVEMTQCSSDNTLTEINLSSQCLLVEALEHLRPSLAFVEVYDAIKPYL
jgi:hypothetical protein